jgi:NitT/TauT family transport system substrate-binding protein
MNNKLRKFIVFQMIAILITSCSGAIPVKNPPLRFAYTQWWGDYTLIIANKQGLFTKYGVEVEPVYYDVLSRSITDFASGQIDGSTMTISDAILVNNHTNISAVAVSDDGGKSVITALPGIFSVADLKGKRIGVSIGSSDELMVSEMLSTANLQIGDVDLVNVTPEDVPESLKKGLIEAGFTWEPYTSQALSLGNHILYSSTAISGLLPDIIVFPTELINKRPDDVKKFLKAWFEAVDFRISHPAEANLIIATTLTIPLDQISGDAKLMSLADNINLFSTISAQDSRSIYNIAKLNAEYLVKSGSISNIPNTQQLLNSSFLSK